MQCRWHCMHDSCGVIDTACTIHAVSLTPHAQKIFQTTYKSENYMQNSHAMKKKFKCMWCHWHRMQNMTPQAQSNGPGSLEREYLSKTYMSPNCPTPPLKKYINLKGIPTNNIFLCMRCHWHRMHDFCIRKSITSQRNRSRIQKGFI
jgi:hypothetical protein